MFYSYCQVTQIKIFYFQELFQNRVIRLREAEFERQKREKEEHVQVRKQERDVKKKQIYYLKCEERIRKRKKLASREVSKFFFI